MDGEEFLKHSTTHPKYLESNSTSHSWAFGALAELFDNSQDANATLVTIDVIANPEYGKILIVQDNGTGMDYKTLHKMLSFGHCMKEDGSIGRYGNGFKSGSMRMGSDAIVFTKDGTTKSIGMLSRTFLERTNATEVLVPMVSWSEHTGEMIFRGTSKESKFMQNSLKVIHEHSPYHGMSEIEEQFDLIEETGTRIVIWNLRIIENTHKYELDFDYDRQDIYLNPDLLPDSRETVDTQKNDHLASLRKYLTIMYMVPKMRIVLRGVPVKTVIYAKTLHMAKTTLYRPKGHEEIKITFGFNPDRRVYGMMLYNKNRLIEALLPVGLHTDHSSRGKGVIGICEANYLQPTHNKQKFVATSDYNKLKAEIAKRLRIYWNALDLLGRIGEFWQTEKNPDEEWVQCDRCLKWRYLEKRKHGLKNAAFTCSLLYKDKTGVRNGVPEACEVPQDPDCIHSHVIFQSTEKDDRPPAGREKWVGARVSLYWDSYDKWYQGEILEYDEKKNKYKVQYDDGDLMWETYDDGFKIVKLASKKKETNSNREKNNVERNIIETRSHAKQEEKETPKKLPQKRKLSEVSSPQETERPPKRPQWSKGLMKAHANRVATRSTAKQDDSEVVQVLKKKLSFIVSSLAKRGLITTDFIDLVEEDNVIELDEVKLCNSLTVSNSNGHTSTANNGDTSHHHTNNSNNDYFDEEFVEYSNRIAMFDANGNALIDRHEEEEEFVDHKEEDLNGEELAEEDYNEDSYAPITNNNNNVSNVARPVPFIQFL